MKINKSYDGCDMCSAEGSTEPRPALHTMACCGKVICGIHALKLLGNLGHLPEGSTHLSQAEARVVAELIATGGSAKQIADEIGVSMHTVRAHIRSAMQKLDAHNRVELVIKTQAQLSLQPYGRS